MSPRGSPEWRENIRQGVLCRIKNDPDFLIRRGKAISAAFEPRPRVTRSHCWKGHEMTFQNTAVTSAGYFRCRTCWYAAVDRYRQKKWAAE